MADLKASPSKRQKVSETQDKVVESNGKAAVESKATGEEEEKKEGVVADDSDDFDGDAGGDDDSFDEDFDAADEEDELPPGEDDEFDMEDYLKWRAANPDEGVEGGKAETKDDPGAELPEDDDEDEDGDEDGDDYDDEDEK